MKKIFVLFPLFCYCLLPVVARGQHGTGSEQGVRDVHVRGIVTDTTGKPLEGSTVLALSPKDSSLITFGRSRSDGRFELRNTGADAFWLEISYVGFGKYRRLVTASRDLGPIRLRQLPQALKEVTVAGEKTPVTIRQDTIEYNAGAFKVRPNAAVEELLKRLPGVEVEKDGTVKAQGQQVQRITVEGKEFFGKDPKIAVKNLPVDAVDKVQVHDRKSDQAQFTGIDDGQREKAINLTLKESKKNLLFGNFSAGAGPDSRYALKANLNRFSKKQQFSVLGMGNNVNQQGFSMNDYMDFTGAGQKMMSGGGMVRIQVNTTDDNAIPLNFGGRTNGFLTNWAGGVNFNNRLSPKTEINGSYFYHNLNQKINQEVRQQASLPDSGATGGTYRSDKDAEQRTGNTSHRLNLVLDRKLDSASSFKWTNRFDYRQLSSGIASQTKTYIGKSSEGEGRLQNSSDSRNGSEGDAVRLNSELLFRHRFAKKGRTLSANLLLGVDNTAAKGFLKAFNSFFGEGNTLLRREPLWREPLRTDTLNQVNTQASDRLNYGLNLVYTEPLGKRKYLELNYSRQHARGKMNREVHDVDRESGAEHFNPALSNRFESDYDYQRGGGNFRWNGKIWNASAGIALQESVLKGQLPLQEATVRRSFTNWLPNARLQYRFSDTRNLNLTYDTDIREPSIQELSPAVDNSDPLNRYEGNPALQPEFNHRLMVQFMNFNRLKFSNLFVFLNMNYTTGKITQSQQVDAHLVRTYRPVNVSNDITWNANVSHGFRIRPAGIRVTLSTNLMHNRSLVPVNGTDNRTSRMENRNTVRAEYRVDELFDINGSARLVFNRTAYSINRQMNQQYMNQNYEIEANLKAWKRTLLSSTLDYAIYNFAGVESNRKVPLWGASVSRFFLKNDRGEVRIAAVDLLNRNVAINRTAQANYVQDERIRSLGRYFLLTFTYSLNRAPAPAGGGMRILRN